MSASSWDTSGQASEHRVRKSVRRTIFPWYAARFVGLPSLVVSGSCMIRSGTGASMVWPRLRLGGGGPEAAELAQLARAAPTASSAVETARARRVRDAVTCRRYLDGGPAPRLARTSPLAAPPA